MISMTMKVKSISLEGHPLQNYIHDKNANYLSMSQSYANYVRKESPEVWKISSIAVNCNRLRPIEWETLDWA